MKNLKKVLALGLALVMILGMFTIASAAETKKTASDFTDWDKVEHKDAVALCVDLGIINGLPDGSFNPEGNLDRASWAKLVYFTATGDDNADAYLGTNTGMNDIKGNWAESYINYLVASKLVSGDGQGNYLPNGTVTVAAGLKTMLTVLGYDADDRGYQNDSAWAGNVITDAKRNGLMDNIDRKNTANVNLTRDNAAQIVYNTLMANTVTAEKGRDNGEKYVTRYIPGTTLAYDVFRVIPITATVKNIDSDGKAIFEGQKYSDGDPANYALNNAVKASTAVVGENVTVFIKVKSAKGNLDEIVSSTVAKAGNAAAKTFTGGVKIAAITAPTTDTPNYDKDVFVGTAASDMAKYLNGQENATLAAEYGAGDIVEVYTNGDGEVSMIKVTTYSVEKLSGDVETRTSSDELYVKVPGVINAWTLADKVDGYQGLAEGDIVLLNKDNNNNYTLEKAEVVTGKVTFKSGSKLTLAGSQYEKSGIANNTGDTVAAFADWNVKGNADNEYEFYLDKNGTVCYINQVSGETATEVAYVLQAAWVSGNGSLTASKYLEVELLFTDGTTQIVRVDKVKSGDDTELNDAAEADESIEGALVDFSVNSKGNYELTDKKATAESGTTNEISQKPVFTGSLTANSKTVFLVQKGDDDAEYFVYTGYANVPKMTASVVKTVSDDNVVTYAFLVTDKFEGDGSDGLIYIKSTDRDEDVNGNKIFSIVTADGSNDKATLAIANADAVTAAGFYTIESTDEDGAATVKAFEADANTKTGTTMTCGNSIVKVGDNDACSYDNTTVCVVVDKNEKGDFDSAGTFSLNSFKVDESNYEYAITMIVDGTTAEYVYVIRSLKPVDAE